jgi:hypothetical protein
MGFAGACNYSCAASIGFRRKYLLVYLAMVLEVDQLNFKGG